MPLHPPRKKHRLPGWDYTLSGAYFVTLCTRAKREQLFGAVTNGEVQLTDVGRVIEDCWRWLPSQYPYVSLDEFCLMPDHLHGILVIEPVRSATTEDVGETAVDGLRRKSLGGLIGAFKTVSTKEVNRIHDTPGRRLWQRNFYDHIIGDAHDLERVRRYIRANPGLCKSSEA